MANTISPREYVQRLQTARDYYKQNKESQLSNDPAQQYKFELGKAVAERPEHFQQKDRTGNRNVDAIDQEVGKRLIAKGACNKDAYASVLDKHSPNAGLQQRPQNRNFYCKSMAESCDKQVNVPKEMQARSKQAEHDGRSKSSIEEQSQRSHEQPKQQPPSSSHWQKMQRER